MSATKSRRQIPLSWVVVAILLFVVGYTWVNLHFRKKGPAYKPYQDANQRAEVVRLLKAGYQRIEGTVTRPIDPQRSRLLGGTQAAATHQVPGGLPSELGAAFVEPPLLAQTLHSALAGAKASPSSAYEVLLQAQLSGHDRAASTVFLFRRGQELTLVPVFEKIDPSLQARWTEATLLLSLPLQTLPAGSYAVTLVGETASLSWKLILEQ